MGIIAELIGYAIGVIFVLFLIAGFLWVVIGIIGAGNKLGEKTKDITDKWGREDK